MPPKKQTTAEQTPSKSLLTFFDRSPNTAGPSTPKPRTSTAGKPVKRRKSGAASRSNKTGSFGTSNAPLVISDDEDVDQPGAVDGPAKAENAEESRNGDTVIDISDDDMIGVSSAEASTSKGTRSKAPLERNGSPSNDAPAIPVFVPDSVQDENGLTSNGLLESPQELQEESKIPPTEEIQRTLRRPESQSAIVPPLSQTSELEQALVEEEGEWNEGDEEGMGMEDLDINDDEEAVMEAMDRPSVDADEPDDPTTGGEKRKRKGKEKVAAVKDCSPEIIALDDSDQEDDDDSLGGREDVDDFDVDDEECPVCGRTFVGMRGDQKRLHVTQCSGTDQADSKPNPPKVQQPISSFCKPGQSFPIKSERQKKADAEREREAAEVKNLKGPNAFKVLMSGNKEDEEWKVAEIDLKRDGKRSVGRRKAPFYKVMTGMPIAVDAFRYGSIPGIKAYFLTHAHSDHYTNLSGSWKHGPIYCSETTANLIKLMLGVDAQWVHGLPWDTPFELPETGGVKVTVIKANHCPGSSLFLFEGKQTINAGDSTIKSPYVGGSRIWRYLHCGDFRACPEMVLHPAIKDKKIDVCYLDTTYLNPQYCFPPQPLVIEACANLARRTVLGVGPADAPEVKMENGEEPDVKPYLEGQADANMQEKGKRLMQDWLVKQEEEVKAENGDGVEKKPRGRTLVIMGTYSIGKERIVKGVARALNSKIYCDARKRGILMCQADPELHAMLTTDPLEATIHLVPLQTIQVDRLQPYLHKLKDHFSRVLAFRPTGWTYSPPAGTNMLPDINHVIRRDQKRTFTDAYLRPMRGSSHQFMIFGVPYSEHSSFFELTCFALSVPGPDVKMIATVNVGNEKSRGKMKKWFEKWQAEKVKRQQGGLPPIVEYRDVTYW